MGAIKSIKGSRKPNLAGHGHKSDDLSFESPKGFPKYGDGWEHGIEPYTPGDLAFQPGFDLQFRQTDKIVLLMGPSGSGKTTFLRALVNSVQSKIPEPVTHAVFNSSYGSGFVLKYARALDVYGVPFSADSRSQEELSKALMRCPDLKSQRRVDEFVGEIHKSLPDKSLEECLRIAVFAYEAGPWLTNSGIALTPFAVQYYETRPLAWYYCKELSPHSEGSAGQRNYAGLETLFKAAGKKDLLCLDDPEISLDAKRKEGLKGMIVSHEGQLFIATHDPCFLDVSQKVIDFNEFGLRDAKGYVPKKEG